MVELEGSNRTTLGSQGSPEPRVHVAAPSVVLYTDPQFEPIAAYRLEGLLASIIKLCTSSGGAPRPISTIPVVANVHVAPASVLLNMPVEFVLPKSPVPPA